MRKQWFVSPFFQSRAMIGLLTIVGGVSVISLSGCLTASTAIVSGSAIELSLSSLDSVKSEQGKGVKQSFYATKNDTWDALLQILEKLKITVVEADKSGYMILAKTEISSFSWGEKVAIFITSPPDSAQTNVEVISKRNVTLNVTAKDWSREILAGLDKKLGSSVSKVSFAKINDDEAVPYLNERRRALYRDFLKMPTPRAFAIAPTGNVGWAYKGIDPNSRALKYCEEIAKTSCKLYAVDQDVVWSQAQ